MSEDHDDEVEMGLVMPFVTCASNGGPHDDQSYVAGWEMGQLDVTLKVAAALGLVTQATVTIHTENLPQTDLLAMKHGFALSSEASEDYPEWTVATFALGEAT